MSSNTFGCRCTISVKNRTLVMFYLGNRHYEMNNQRQESLYSMIHGKKLISSLFFSQKRHQPFRQTGQRIRQRGKDWRVLFQPCSWRDEAHLESCRSLCLWLRSDEQQAEGRGLAEAAGERASSAAAPECREPAQGGDRVRQKTWPGEWMWASGKYPIQTVGFEISSKVHLLHIDSIVWLIKAV